MAGQGVVRGPFGAEETAGSLTSLRALGLWMSVLIRNAFGQCSRLYQNLTHTWALPQSN